jgi:Tfp pilus assembly protein PilF
MRSIQSVLQEAMDAHTKGDFDKAEVLYDRVLAKESGNWAILMNVGTLYCQVRRFGLAQVFLRMAAQANPKEAGIWGNLGAVYRTEGMLDKARECYDKALEIDPQDGAILSNVSGLYINARMPDKAIYWADKALAVDPDRPEAANHKAIALLEMGRFEEGFKLYDARLRLPQFHRRPYACPVWDGKSSVHLAIHGEQGLGDEIMFLSCVEVARHCKSVRCEINHRLVKLLQNSFPWIKFFGSHDELIADAQACGEIPEAYIAVGSLPQHHWPPSRKPYLKPTTTYPKQQIGLSWFGGTLQTHETLRNTILEEWTPLKELGNCVSLQYGPRADDAKVLGIPHDTEGIADIDRLAAMIKACDLVITVCNTTVHLAGALGVPVVVLTPHAPAWRYGLKADGMVWYESPKLVRQQFAEPWSSVIRRAKYEAEEMLQLV